MRRRKAVFAASMMLTALALSIYLLNPVISPYQLSNRVSSRGSIKAIGVGVYSDAGCSNRLSSIAWGTLEPSASQDIICYIRNEGNSAMTLSLSTANWSPSNASQYLTLTWDYAGKSLAPSGVVKVIFKLAVAANISGITDFSFDIIIIGSG